MRLKRLISKALTLPPHTLTLKLLAKTKTYLRYKLRKYRLLAHPLTVSNSELMRIFDVMDIEKINEKLGSPIIDNRSRSKIVTLHRDLYLHREQETIEKAEKICSHVFDLLGSGETRLGQQINWHKDFKTGKVWPLKYYKELQVVSEKGGFDVKVPWELSRFQHLIVLGKAYWLTSNEKYTKEFVGQVESWLGSNPVEFGVNWKSTMDVAIRAVNWVIAYYFFRSSPEISSAFREKLIKSLLLHGRFVERNLDWGTVRSNHYLSDIVGLLHLGNFFAKTREGKRWEEQALRCIVEEMGHQVHKDGVDFEASIGYHRLVTEMFLSAAILCLRNGRKLPDTFMSKLERMIEFVMCYTEPSGKAPTVGDADDGRLHVFGVNPTNDHRYLLSIGAVLFNRGDFKRCAQEFNEEAFWLLGEEGLTRFRELHSSDSEVKSELFKQGGFAVMRHKNLYMIVDIGGVGRSGLGGHGHCDTLSFELAVNGRSLVVDPGAYVYTSSPVWRNIFRGTAYHNTVMVDNEEMNRLYEGDFFAMADDARGILNKWISTEEYDILDAQHEGYTRLKSPVVHRRIILFNKKGGYWVLVDELSTTGEHTYCFHLHFLPSAVSEHETKSFIVKTDDSHGPNLLVVPFDVTRVTTRVLDGWVSESYGKKISAPVLRFSTTKNGPMILATILLPFYGGETPSVKGIVREASAFVDSALEEHSVRTRFRQIPRQNT